MFFKAILKLISNDELIYDMGKEGVETANEKFFRKHLKMVYILYENILGAKNE